MYHAVWSQEEKQRWEGVGLDASSCSFNYHLPTATQAYTRPQEDTIERVTTVARCEPVLGHFFLLVDCMPSPPSNFYNPDRSVWSFCFYHVPVTKTVKMEP